MPRVSAVYIAEPTVASKQCKSCGEVKPADCFKRDRSLLSGLRGRCKECTSEYDRLRFPNRKPRTKAQRQAEHRRAAEGAGREYHTWDEWLQVQRKRQREQARERGIRQEQEDRASHTLS
jgi:hypothetical protein